MFDTQAYRNILNSVEGDIKKVEKKLCATICADAPFYKDLAEFLSSPSKRIRSLVSILYLKAKGFDIEENQILLLAVVELIHNASLIHDDVIDEDKIRRGVESLNTKFGNKMAIISGDYLLSAVMQILTGFGKIELFEIFSKVIKSMCEGEIQQYSNLYKITTIEEYIDKTYKKTGALFEAGLAGTTFLNCGEIDTEAVEFARNFGIAFQIRDDLNNVLDNGKDIQEGVYNSAVIYSGGERILPSGIEKSKVLLNNYLDRAELCILELSETEYKTALINLVEWLKND